MVAYDVFLAGCPARTTLDLVAASRWMRATCARRAHLEAMAIVIIGLLFGGYDPYSVFAFVSPGRTGQPFTSR